MNEPLFDGKINVNDVNGLVNYLMTTKTPKFVNLNHYNSKSTGEVSNYIINTNISVLNAKKRDFHKLKKVDNIYLEKLANENNISIDILKIAHIELLESAKRNLSENKENRTNQSKGQENTYINLSPSLKLNVNTNELHIFGQIICKSLVKAGEHKEVKHNEKTIAKNIIKKTLDLSSDKFRNFIISRIKHVNLKYQQLNIII